LASGAHSLSTYGIVIALMCSTTLLLASGTRALEVDTARNNAGVAAWLKFLLTRRRVARCLLH
jgi:hypothetical protein